MLLLKKKLKDRKKKNIEMVTKLKRIVYLLAIFMIWIYPLLVTATNGGVISMTTTELEGGAIEVGVSVTKIKGFITMIKVVEPWTTPTCNPSISIWRPLDLKDSYNTDRDISPSQAGPWSLRDPGDGTRQYTATFSPTRLRQQFVNAEKNVIAVGAITGGAVGASIYACTYQVKIADDGVTQETTIVGTVSTDIVAKSNVDAPEIDLRAFILSPIIVSSDNTRIKFTIETRTSLSCVGDAIGEPPAIQHIKTEISERDLPVCSSINILGGECKECIQFETVELPIVSIEESLDIVSLFKDPETHANFVGHFLASPTTFCSEYTCGWDNDEFSLKDRSVRTEPKRLTTNAAVYAGIVSQNIHTEGLTFARDTSTEEMYGVIFNGKYTCLNLALDPEYTAIEPAAIKINNVVLKTPNDEIKMVKKGYVNDQLARFAQASLKKTSSGGSKFCFALSLDGDSSKIEVDWEIIGITVEEQNVDPLLNREFPGDHGGHDHDGHGGHGGHDSDDHHDHRPGWCADSETCIGTLIINADHRYHDYDHHGPHDKGHGDGTFIAGLFGLIFFVFIIILVIAVCCIGWGGKHHIAHE